jgi:hypothetical protein
MESAPFQIETQVQRELSMQQCHRTIQEYRK